MLLVRDCLITIAIFWIGASALVFAAGNALAWW